MTTVYLGLGSNKDPLGHLRIAIEWLDRHFHHLRLSPAYRSASVGFAGDDFINLVAAAETRVPALDLKRLLTEFEDANGRDRSKPKFSDRVIDIDILLYGDTVSDDPRLILPREEVLRYAHVLRPLAELAPDLRHPRDGRRLAEIWRAFDGARDYLQALPDFTNRIGFRQI